MLVFPAPRLSDLSWRILTMPTVADVAVSNPNPSPNPNPDPNPNPNPDPNPNQVADVAVFLQRGRAMSW